DANSLNAFTIYVNQRNPGSNRIQIATTSEVDKQKWINVLQTHIDYSNDLMQRGFRFEDSEDESDILPSDYMQSMINTAQAHQSIMNRHIRGMREFVDQDLKDIMAELPNATSIEIEHSTIVLEICRKFMPGKQLALAIKIIN